MELEDGDEISLIELFTLLLTPGILTSDLDISNRPSSIFRVFRPVKWRLIESYSSFSWLKLENGGGQVFLELGPAHVFGVEDGLRDADFLGLLADLEDKVHDKFELFGPEWACFLTQIGEALKRVGEIEVNCSLGACHELKSHKPLGQIDSGRRRLRFLIRILLARFAVQDSRNICWHPSP